MAEKVEGMKVNFKNGQIDKPSRARQGSEWRKWDFHVHTPFSYLNNQFGDNFDEYVQTLFKKAIEKEISVIGITDYFCIEGYKKIKNEYLDDKAKLGQLFSEDEIAKIKEITLLPNIEFRLDRSVKIDKKNKPSTESKINFHVIFSDTVAIEDIEENFLHRLEIITENWPQSETQYRSLTRRNMEILGEKLKREQLSFQRKSYIYVGMNCTEVNDEKIVSVLKSNRSTFEGKYILCLPSDENLSDVSWSDQGHNFRKILIQRSDVLFNSNQGSIDWGLGKKHPTQQAFIDEFKTLKPCIWGSDAHDPKTLFEPAEQRYTWIKADTTFEGLKQIIYEPEERVRIQKNNPSFADDKPYFSELVIKKEVSIYKNTEDQVCFREVSLPLNKNLVAIIGGRGTGKSMIVDYWAGIFKNISRETQRTEDSERAKDSEYTKTSDFNLKYAKNNIPSPSEETYDGGNDNNLDYIYIPQRRLKEVTEKRNVGDEVKKLLKIEELSFSPEVDKEIQATLNAVIEIRKWFDEENDRGEKPNDRDFVASLKKQNEDYIRSITTEANKEKLETYTANISQIKEIESRITRFADLINKIKKTQEELNKEINAINAQFTEEEGYKKVPEIDFKDQIEALAENSKSAYLLKEEKDNRNNAIKSDFEKDGFTGDLTSLLRNAETYQAQIKWAETQLELISQKEIALEKALNDRAALGVKIKQEYERQKENIDEAWSGILSIHEGKNKELIEKILLKDAKIKVTGEIVFDEQAFFTEFYRIFDRRSVKNIDILKGIYPIHNFEEWIQFVSVREFKEERVEDHQSFFFGMSERSKYLKTIPKITYDGKPLEKLSVGQRGTVYLRLKLATDAFSKPIVFDQPEDDLDNEFIMNELVSIFKQLKKCRQIIIVTHNANLVVNADAEQVIVANNVDERLSYTSGALENSDIIESVCKVLEGGKAAFERRKDKYSSLTNQSLVLPKFTVDASG
ncbi:DNA repair ATPase [Candidatus Magnetobacterium bavaricum]|uniref:DNA repair ATPase n=1 Tax=Candidatus Magnetobacterium bavaricum TaxID=29290 RepID=A0A0F3GKZ9_9BACT|nr:DNA repair ATPase [Candidatus Magnetobacterium bavaricum]